MFGSAISPFLINSNSQVITIWNLVLNNRGTERSNEMLQWDWIFRLLTSYFEVWALTSSVGFSNEDFMLQVLHAPISRDLLISLPYEIFSTSWLCGSNAINLLSTDTSKMNVEWMTVATFWSYSQPVSSLNLDLVSLGISLTDRVKFDELDFIVSSSYCFHLKIEDD